MIPLTFFLEFPRYVRILPVRGVPCVHDNNVER